MANALYTREDAYRNALAANQPSVDQTVLDKFGMRPGMDRSTFLPRYDSQQGWIAPNALYNAARGYVSAGVAMRGGQISPEDAMNFAGNISLGSYGVSRAMKNAAPGPGKTLPMTVYHGSPHNFDAFDMSKIGTGEGAQAYGHGLYVAEKKGVAKSYRNDLSEGTWNPVKPFNETAADILPRIDEVIGSFRGPVDHKSGPILAFLKNIRSHIAQSKDWNEAFGQYGTAMRDLEKYGVKTKDLYRYEGGKLYTVDLPDEHIAKMLDWDAPLSEQPEAVRKALKAAGVTKQFRDNLSDFASPQGTRGAGRGQNVYQMLSHKLGGDKQASEFLKDSGISGIRYFDGGSRSAGAGTRNYVVFDDKLLKILRKE